MLPSSETLMKEVFSVPEKSSGRVDSANGANVSKSSLVRKSSSLAFSVALIFSSTLPTVARALSYEPSETNASRSTAIFGLISANLRLLYFSSGFIAARIRAISVSYRLFSSAKSQFGKSLASASFLVISTHLSFISDAMMSPLSPLQVKSVNFFIFTIAIR